MRPSLRRALATAGLSASLLAALPGVALAHSGGDATNYESVITDAGDPGLAWTMYGGDALLELQNRTGEVVLVEGYDGEPYLRFVPGDGVYENVHSPATYYNTDRYAGVSLPPDADATLAPEWTKVATGDRYAWHDHRVHWMSPVPPSPVFNDPDHDQTVFAWTLGVEVGDGAAARLVTVAGTLFWKASQPWWIPLAVPGSLFVAAAVLVLARTRPDGDRWPAPARAVAAMIWLTCALMVVRVVDDVRAVPGVATGSAGVVVTTTVTLLAVLLLTIHAWRGHLTGYLALAAAGFATFMLFGRENSAVLSAPLILTRLPVWVARTAVGASMAVVGPTLLTCAVAGWRLCARIDRPDGTIPVAAAEVQR